MATSARLEQVVANAKATERRRRALADEFRASLLAEIGPVGYSVIRRALVENAVSAYVEVSELSARFQRGRATESALTRLGLARGQLTRALRLLGGFDVALDANTL